MTRGFSREEKHRAAKRELDFRRMVYPKRIAAGAMRQQDADYQIALMEAIAADYAPEPEPDLFGGFKGGAA